MRPQDDIPTTPNPEVAGALPASPAPTEPALESRAAQTPRAGASNDQPPAPTLERTIERIARDLILDRRRERRWRTFFRLAWFGLVLALAWALLGHRGPGASPSGKHTALIEVRGEIAAESEANAEQLVGAMKNAFEDSNAMAVVLRINSPGGSPVQAGIINDEMRRLKALHKKPVYAVVEEMCASGAYYIAVGADEIFVDKASLVGSIGVLMDGFGFAGAMEKLGVERRLLTAGDNKGMLDPFSPQNDRHKAYAQSMINQIHLQFIKVVKDGRGARLKENADTFSGLFWNGEEAVRMGLADHFGNLDHVARDIVKAEEVVDYTPKQNIAERLAKRFGAGLGEGAIKALRALPSPR